jgi:hypothetical protein
MRLKFPLRYTTPGFSCAPFEATGPKARKLIAPGRATKGGFFRAQSRPSTGMDSVMGVVARAEREWGGIAVVVAVAIAESSLPKDLEV